MSYQPISFNLTTFSFNNYLILMPYTIFILIINYFLLYFTFIIVITLFLSYILYYFLLYYTLFFLYYQSPKPSTHFNCYIHFYYDLSNNLFYITIISKHFKQTPLLYTPIFQNNNYNLMTYQFFHFIFHFNQCLIHFILNT